MQRKLIVTGDGSHSFSVEEMNVSYHSVHGAIRESMHVFIDAGLRWMMQQSANDPLSILDVGFGTGLNALLTEIEMERTGRSAYYLALEPYPLNDIEFRSLNYCELLGRKDLRQDFMSMHECAWNRSLATENMLLQKSAETLQAFRHTTKFNLIYFDAFDPKAQPELWTREIFANIFSMLDRGGVLVTYSSKGAVRRAMEAAGFHVEKIPGPPRKREIVRAGKED